jgi:putative flippase GtrA
MLAAMGNAGGQMDGTGLLRPRRNVSRVSRNFMRFVAVAGAGWLLDFGILSLLTFNDVLPLFWRNMISSITAATFVFLVARRKVHLGAEGALLGRTAAYVAYSLIIILAASSVMSPIYRALSREAHLAAVPAAYLMLLAKVIITPPQLLSNFVVSKLFAERRFA